MLVSSAVDDDVIKLVCELMVEDVLVNCEEADVVDTALVV